MVSSPLTTCTSTIVLHAIRGLETAQLFSKHIVSVYVPEPQNPHNAYPNLAPFSNLTINSEDIVNALSALQNSSSTGPDYIPALFIKQCFKTLQHPQYCTIHMEISFHNPNLQIW